MCRVSVIVPIYNVQAYVSRCLNSLLRQTWQDMEILCVDDCGQDKSMEIVERARGKYPEKIRVIHSCENVGLGGARDKGMKAARGQYLMFVDSDDYVRKDFVETYAKAAERSQADLVVGGFVRVEGNRRKKYIPDEKKDPDCPWTFVSAWTKLYRRSFLEENGIDFRGVRRYEDEGFAYRVLLKEPDIVVIPYAGYYYRMNPSSITMNRSQDRTHIFEEYTRQILDVYREAVPPSDVQALFQYSVMSGLTANLLFNCRGCGIRRMRELVNVYDRALKEVDPGICKNAYISLRLLRSEPWKKRYAAWLVMRTRRLHCEKLLFALDSML